MMKPADIPEDPASSGGPPADGLSLGVVAGIVLTLAPEIGPWLFGAEAGPTVELVRSALRGITGSDEPSVQASVLADPDKAAALRIELARIAAGRTSDAHATLTGTIADLADRPLVAPQPAQPGSAMAWGAPVVSVVVLLTFGGVIAMTLTHAMPNGAEAVLNVLMGTLGAMATSVVSYWVGSSAGSARKDARLAQIADR